MNRSSRPWLCGTLAAALLLAACNGATPGTTDVRASSSKQAPASGAAKAPAAKPEEPAQTLTRLVSQGVTRELTGKIKLISDAGGSLLSDQGGSLLSDQGGSLISPETGRIISNNSGGLISNNSGNLIGKTKFYGLRSQGALAEDLLADARIEVLDAEGRVLLDEAGKPIQATSDASGRYSLKAALPDENVILRVKLNEKLAGTGAELKAMVVAKTLGASGSLDIDTSASLAANYVLAEYVKGQQGVFNRLPQDANRDLRNEVEKARAILPKQVPSYQPAAMAKTLGDLRTQAKPLDETLERVKALLLLGQENLGQGLAATQVPLSTPVAVARDAQGNLYIAESVVGRIRKINADGRISVLAGDNVLGQAEPGIRALDATFQVISDMAVEPDGSLVVVDAGSHRVWRIDPGGILQAVAGTGIKGIDGENGPAASAQLNHPVAVAVGPNGTLYITEEGRANGSSARLLEVGADKVLRAVPIGIAKFNEPLHGIAATADGALWITEPGPRGSLLRRPPGATAFVRVISLLNMGWNGRLAPASNEDVYLTESGGNRVLRVSAAGSVTRVAGAGNPGEALNETSYGQSLEQEAQTLRRPAGMATLPEGSLLVVDSVKMNVRKINPGETNPTAQVVAGSTGLQTLGTARGIAVNAPGGLAVAPNGRDLIFAETAAAVVKQLRDGQVSIVAGGRTAPWQDGGPAVAAGLVAPVAVAYDPDGNLWITESANARILKMEPSGALKHMAGSGLTLDLTLQTPVFNPTNKPAREVQLGRPIALAISPLDRRPYWIDQAFGVICRLTAEDRIEVIAGSVPATYGEVGDAGDGGPAANARFNYPSGLAFDQAGNLYVSDSLNFKLRKIAMQEPGRPIQTIAGLGLAGTLVSLLNGAAADDAAPAKSQALRLPAGLFTDQKNRLYVVEAGTSRLGALVNSMGAGFQLPADFPKHPARIRRLDLNQPDPVFTTIAGPGGRILTETRGEQTLGVPLGLTLDASGQMIISDTLNNQIKLVPNAVLD